MAINPIIKQKAEDIRKKIFGSEVRESLASGIEAISEDVEATIGRQDYVEEQFQNVIDETTDKDVISAPELIAARNGKSNLKTRLDEEHAEVTAQLQQTEQEFNAQLAQTSEDVSTLHFTKTRDNIVIAHRGATIDAPDNTIKAIRRAAELGYKMVELDVRITTDGVWYLFHNDTTVSNTNISKETWSLTSTDLQTMYYTAPSWTIQSGEIHNPPSFTEVLEECVKLGLYINLDGAKTVWSGNRINQIVALLKQYNMIHKTFFVLANEADREKLKAIEPNLAIGMVCDGIVFENVVTYASNHKYFIAGYSVTNLTDTLINQLVTNNITILAHTCSTIYDMTRLQAKGVKFIETDYVLDGSVI